MLLFLKKWKKRGKVAKNAIRQGNMDHIDIRNLIHKSWHTFANAPSYTYHCISCAGWKMRVRMLSLT